MWTEIFKFELCYRLKRPETYLFFVFILAFSIVGVDFIFQGVEHGMVMKNATIVIGKTMGAITGIFMILTSMIMGMPIIRDDKYQITHLIYTTPIRKFDLLIGRFLGSFIVLLIIFSGLPIGMMLGEMMPWHIDEEMLPFRFVSYISTFIIVVLPSLFFGATLFFVTGMLSRNLLVVYTQGIILFVIFMLTKAITNEYAQAVFDPFSLTTLTHLTESWTIMEKNSLLLPLNGALLINKIFWTGLGVAVFGWGYSRFRFSSIIEHDKSNQSREEILSEERLVDTALPIAIPQYSVYSQCIQCVRMSLFYAKSLLKETSFWAIVICGGIIIFINSINLGTLYGVDSYPTTYFIVEELQELSLYFFIIILLFYSGELNWKEHSSGLDLMCDATPISSLLIICSKIAGLLGVYVVLIISLILSGIVFQLMKGYYHLDLLVYFSGFFIEILPFLILYTVASFFIHSLINNKFLGILATLIFIIATMAMHVLNVDYKMINFGGGPLMLYSEMNGYGHYMTPYLRTKLYWMIFCIFLLLFAAAINRRGVDVKWTQRIRKMKSNFTPNRRLLLTVTVILFLISGGYIYTQTYVLNEVWSEEDELEYRAQYEKSLKPLEYKPQLSIVESNLKIELYPDQRSYKLEGSYILKNQENVPINELHIQKAIKSDISLNKVQLSIPTTIDSQYSEFEYTIYKLAVPLLPGDSMIMSFIQNLKPKGFNTGNDIDPVLYNGSFIRNNEFPTIGYNKKYELSDQRERELFELLLRPDKASITNEHELKVARSGSDSHGVKTNIVIGTKGNQIAVTSGHLLRRWKTANRNYFEYVALDPIINFYSILSGEYNLHREDWLLGDINRKDTIALEIYYHPRHNYNLDRMMDGMKASLDYCSSNFAPYQYKELKIVEFPRYQKFAQSLPNMIPFSESIGFMLDIDDEADVDMTFFVTAHEVAHQWWGMQVEAANVRGHNFILESLSQYAAMMVLKRHFPQEKIDQFLELQEELYDIGKKKSKGKEVPLYLVADEAYIYYNKGAIAMYRLQELIGEKRVNLALRSFLVDWNTKTGILKFGVARYATSEDLLSYILNFTPPDLNVEVLKLFKEV